VAASNELVVESRSAWGGEVRSLLTLAWPMMLTNLAQTAMTATDVVFIGRLGGESLAAGALGSNMYFLASFFGLGLVYATSPAMASELGANRHSVREVRRILRQGLWLAVLISLPIWLFLWNTGSVLLLMGQQPALAARASRYVHYVQWGLMPFYGYIVLRSFLAALERPGWALVIMTLAVGLNAWLDWLLIFGNSVFPPLGIAGAGIATSLASLFMFCGLVGVIVVNRRFRRYHLFGRLWRVSWPRLLKLMRLGVPISAMFLFEVSLFNFAAFVIGLIDPVQLAAHAIAIQVASVTFMIPLGLSQAATVRVGLAWGAGDTQGVRRSGWTALGLGVTLMAVMALMMLIWPKALIGLFIDIGDPANQAIVAHAVSFLALAALFQVADGAQAVGAGLLRGMHDTRTPMIYAAVGYWGIGAPLGLLLAFHFGWGGRGVWSGLCCGLSSVAALLLYRWLRRDELNLMGGRHPL
jgi:MATE family multidrug resistance protein